MADIPAPVAEYLSALDPERRAVVSGVRDVVAAAMPEGYEEGIAYGMIGWTVPLARYSDTYNGQPLGYVSLAAQKRHYALYLNSVYSGLVDPERLRERWEAGGRKLDLGKSCLRFRRLEDLDLDLVAEVVASTPVAEFIASYERSRAKSA